MSTPIKPAFQFNEALDGKSLSELFADDLSYAVTVFEGFLEEMPTCYEEMRVAFEANDVRSLKSAAHKCKTLFAYVGLSSITEQLQAMETACNFLENTSTMEPLFAELLRKRQGIESLIEEEIKRLQQYYEN